MHTTSNGRLERRPARDYQADETATVFTDEIRAALERVEADETCEQCHHALATRVTAGQALCDDCFKVERAWAFVEEHAARIHRGRK